MPQVLPTAASVVSSGLGAYPTVYYDREAVLTLYNNLFLYGALDLKQMPEKNGVALQMFGYSAMAANTTAVTEGTPFSGQTLTQNTRTITLSQYADYISFSDKVVLTAISDTVTEGSKELGYRGALTVDNIINTAIDVSANSDSATRINVADGTYMTAAKARQAAMSLRSVNIKPKDNGYFYGVIASLAAFDLINDTNANGVSDLNKYADSLAPKNPALVGFPAAGRIGVIGQVEWFESNSLATQTNWQSSAHTAFFNYVIGKQAIFGSSLGKTKIGEKNFSVDVRKYDGDNSLDPAGLIAATAAYNFFFGVAVRPGSTNGFRRIAVESSIGT